MPVPPPVIDIHCHPINFQEHVQIFSLDTHQLKNIEIGGELDHLISERHTNSYFSIGIHPWFIENQDLEQAMLTLESYSHHGSLLAIGECGLDKTVAVGMDVQTALFERHIVLSERLQKPLILHCVRAFNELLAIKLRLKPSMPWIIHGYNNKPQLAEQLIKHGFYLSLGKALLHDQSNATNTLKIMPLDRLFLETDEAGDVSISDIYAAAAKTTGLTNTALRRRISDNFNSVFLHQ